jgi:hypothetical protein
MKMLDTQYSKRSSVRFIQLTMYAYRNVPHLFDRMCQCMKKYIAISVLIVLLTSNVGMKNEVVVASPSNIFFVFDPLPIDFILLAHTTITLPANDAIHQRH